MKVQNINMVCAHNGVRINLNFNEGGNEVSAAQEGFENGYNVTRHDRYSLDGRRLTTVDGYFPPFTPEYFAELDRMAEKFASLVTISEE